VSSASKGGQREHAVMTALRSVGYRCTRVSASGRRKSDDAKANGVPCDVIAYARRSGWPHLWIEVGGIGKRIRAAFDAMKAEPLPAGHVAIVARCVRRRWRWYASEDERFDSLRDLLRGITR
jgi:hypothetical protein